MSSFLTACPSPKEKKVTQVKIHMGDPDDLLIGTTMENKIPKNIFDGIESVQLKMITIISSEALNKGKDSEPSSLTALGISDAGLMDNKDIAKLILEKSATSDIYFKSTENEGFITLKSTSLDGLTWSSVGDKKNPAPVEFIHFSLSKDRRYFTILARVKEPGKKQLFSLMFALQENVNPKTLSAEQRKYLYTNEDHPYRWTPTEPLTISTCGEMPTIIRDETVRAIGEWAKVLSDKLSVNHNHASVEYPFSDLNQNCIKYIDGMLSYENVEKANYGITINTNDSENTLFVNSLIFIFKREYEKHGVEATNSLLDFTRKYTILHELGHLFGLEHQFNTSIKSIMSYEFERISAKLYPYDIAAVRALYE